MLLCNLEILKLRRLHMLFLNRPENVPALNTTLKIFDNGAAGVWMTDGSKDWCG